MTDGTPTRHEKIAEGWTAEIYALDDDRVLKLYKPGFAVVCEGEYRKLAFLRQHLPFVPRVYALVELEGRVGYSMERIPGLPLGSGADARPGEVASRLRDLVRQFEDVPVDGAFEPARSRIARRLSTSAGEVGSLARCAADLLAEMPIGDRLCHGDFHPSNVLVTPGRDYVIDWNGAGVDDLNCDVAKSLILMRFAPPGLAFGHELHGKRDEVCARYLSLLREGNLVDEDRLGRWLFIRAVELLSLGIPSFADALLPILGRTARKSGDFPGQVAGLLLGQSTIRD